MSDAINNLGLVAPIKDGSLDYEASKETKSATERGSSVLGKDAFLQLLVAQMQYQDPLEPNTNTEYVSQLATFSQLEELQNIGSETEKSQAFSLVGKYVTLTSTDTNGNTVYKEGIVDFVNMSGKNITLSVNGSTYNYDQLYQVMDSSYYIQQKLPGIDKEVALTYNAFDPQDVTIDVNFGSDEFVATDAAVVVGGVQLDRFYITCKDDKIIIDKSAFDNLKNGEYGVSIVFNNPQYTTINDKVKLTVYNSKVEADDGTVLV